MGQRLGVYMRDSDALKIEQVLIQDFFGGSSSMGARKEKVTFPISCKLLINLNPSERESSQGMPPEPLAFLLAGRQRQLQDSKASGNK